MSIYQFFAIFWARRWLIVLSTLLCFTGAIMIAKLLPPRYESESRLMLDIVKPDPVTGEVVASQFARAYVKTQVELIRDYRIAGQVVDDLGWEKSPVLAARYAARAGSDTRDFRRWLAQLVIDNTDVKLIEGSNILEISYTGSSPESARKVADTIRKAYVDQAVSLRREDAQNNADWFRTQASRIRELLTAAEKRKADFERANNIILGEDGQSDTDSTRLSALAASAPAQGTSVVTPPSAVVQPTESPQLAQANAAVAAAERVLGPNNPDLINLKRQRDAIAASLPVSAPVSAPRVVTTGPSIGALYSAQQAKVLAQRGKVTEARQLAADVAVLRGQYLKTASRSADLAQQGEATESGMTLLGNAVAPASPSFPRWPLIIIGSLGLGFALGIIMALLIELFSRKVRGIDDLRMEGVPVIGVMARPLLRRSGPRRFLSLPGRRRDEEAYA